jgi:hypothetical protein
MLLSQVRLVGYGPFEDLTVSLADESGAPKRLAVVLGSGGVGKTSLLAAIASTRPGSAIPPRPRAGASSPSFVVADWVLGDDDPARPHVLRVASPNAVLEEREDEALVRRREQALFDRRATEGGHVLIGFSATRRVTRAPAPLGPSDRAGVLRYDPRALVGFDEATHADVARDTKQALTYAAIAAALGGNAELDRALREVCRAMAQLTGHTYAGVDAKTFEPTFEAQAGARITFDELPTFARMLLAYGVITARTLHAAYPARPPREAEGVLLVDELELYQEPSVARAIVPTLRGLFPRVQLVVTTSQPQIALACDASDVLALRRMPTTNRVELHEGTIH